MEKIKVLLADDNQAIMKLLVDYFAEKQEIEITGCAHDGVEALQLIEVDCPDVLLLDIIMPRLDGFAVLQALTERERSPRPIVLTGLSRDDFIIRAMQMGASYYMVKPLDVQVLYKCILEVASQEEISSGVLSEKPTTKPQHTVEEQITNLFLSIGIPAHIKGYQYLREAVCMVIENHDVINRITKELYPGITRRYGTTASKVERTMRHAIEVAWGRGRLESINRMYGYRVFSPDDKPTNGEFIPHCRQGGCAEEHIVEMLGLLEFRGFVFAVRAIKKRKIHQFSAFRPMVPVQANQYSQFIGLKNRWIGSIFVSIGQAIDRAQILFSTRTRSNDRTGHSYNYESTSSRNESFFAQVTPSTPMSLVISHLLYDPYESFCKTQIPNSDSLHAYSTAV